jgi:ribosomal protein S18 acetylase RimI-like enzyme
MEKCMDCNIERATAEDAEEILALQKAAFRIEAERYGDFTIAPLTQTLDAVRTELDTMVVLKAVVEGRVIGSVRAVEKVGTCYIFKLIVQPALHNQGIGASLMRAIEAAFPEARRFELFTGHRSDNNIHLYKKLGYREFKGGVVPDGPKLICFEKLRCEM